MNRMAELLQKKAAMKEEVRQLNNDGKVDEAEAKLEEMRSINKQIKLQEALDEEDKEEAARKIELSKRAANAAGTEGFTPAAPSVPSKNELEERMVFAKAIKGGVLTTEERAVVASAVNADGGFLVPKSIANDINLLKRQYKSMKDIVGVIPVTTESGSFVVEDTSTLTDLINFDDTTTGLPEVNPKFKDVQYKVVNYGAITPIAKSFLQDETANFMNYLNGFFARKAVRTENTKIFAELKTGKTVSPLTDLASIKKVVNVTLDPALSAISVWVMNQDAFNKIDTMQDTTGKPLLQPDPSNATSKMLLGLPVHVFSNAELPSVATKGQIFVGALREGCKFFDREVYEVAISQEAGFTKNQVVARIVERFDVKQADAAAYVWCDIPA
jgi:HK97 family phage major capsid protein